MAANSKVPYTEDSFNPWWGCTPVPGSPACDHCYARAFARRCGYDCFGDNPRRLFVCDHWDEPLRWNKQAASAGRRRRVFCGSMCDVFEDRPDLKDQRLRLFNLIGDTPHLFWLLLTKRPENILPMMLDLYLSYPIPPNIAFGITAENQPMLDARWPHLQEAARGLPPSLLFISAEPLLGPLDLIHCLDEPRLGWLITGGESGPHARPSHPKWFTDLRDDCMTFDIPFFFKQWGEWEPMMDATAYCDGLRDCESDSEVRAQCRNVSIVQHDGRVFTPAPTLSAWEDWQAQYEDTVCALEDDSPEPVACHRVGKKHAGRLLDGREHLALPEILK